MIRRGVGVVGTGALGTVLARRLVQCGYVVRAVIGRRPEAAQALADDVGAAVASTTFEALPPDLSLVFCCVPDDTVRAVARAMGRAQHNWSGCTVAHTSGVLTAGALYGLGEQGAALLSFHPLQSFTANSAPEAFSGIYIGLEGDPPALARGTQVALDLGARSITLAPEVKARYHLAASMASNFLVTLMALVGEVLSNAGIDRQQGAALVRPLVEGTWANLGSQLPEDALTGPIARGDHQTVSRHLEALADHLPHLLPVYATLGAETVRVAVRSGRLDAGAAEHVLDALHAALGPYRDSPM